jgi:hypothetical protein
MSIQTTEALLAGIAYGAIVAMLCMRGVLRAPQSRHHLLFYWPGALVMAGLVALAFFYRHATQVGFDEHSIDQIWLATVFSAASIPVFLVSLLCCLIVTRRRRSKHAKD